MKKARETQERATPRGRTQCHETRLFPSKLAPSSSPRPRKTVPRQFFPFSEGENQQDTGKPQEKVANKGELRGSPGEKGAGAEETAGGDRVKARLMEWCRRFSQPPDNRFIHSNLLLHEFLSFALLVFFWYKAPCRAWCCN